MRKNKKYSIETKTKAVKAYLQGEGGLREICKKYGISDKHVLQNWILWYNGHREFKERASAKGKIYMTKGRKTTQEERAPRLIPTDIIFDYQNSRKFKFTGGEGLVFAKQTVTAPLVRFYPIT